MLISIRLLAVFSAAFFSFSSYAQSASDKKFIAITVTPTEDSEKPEESHGGETIISAETISRDNPVSLVDVLREIPGLTVRESGPGGAVSISFRGADSRQTQVLIDGIPVNDPSGVSGGFDFSTITPDMVERIEAKAGPQGSNATGGVINIITKDGGKKPFQGSVKIEAGRYRSLSSQANVYGSLNGWRYAFSLSGINREGFSSYGYRIDRFKNLEPLENDPLSAVSATGRVSFSSPSGWGFDLGGAISLRDADYDAAFGLFPDTPSTSKKAFYLGWLKTKYKKEKDLHELTLSANRTDRSYRSVNFSSASFPDPSFVSKNYYVGDNYRARYAFKRQIAPKTSLTLGALAELERSTQHQENLIPAFLRKKEIRNSRSLFGGFSKFETALTDSLDFSLAGDVKALRDQNILDNVRARLSYKFPGMETRLYASAGLAENAPSLFQLYDQTYGNTTLSPERNVGVDIGFKTVFPGKRVSFSMTRFMNRGRNLIIYEIAPECAFGCYKNSSKTTSSGFETTISLVVFPRYVTLEGNLTAMETYNRETGRRLPFRPNLFGRIGLVITPIKELSIRPRVTFVGNRYSDTKEKNLLKSYARVDLNAEWRINAAISAYLRGENLLNAKFEDIPGYGVTGRAFYAGLKARF